jgi:3'-phosphoadenosine 5'-phosphosulfate sulfotransferase (PAPS reductase)/FAD synthetase
MSDPKETATIHSDAPAVMGRVVAWYSHGAASAIATKMALAHYGPDVVIACIDTGSEHDDNERFRADCEAWFDHPILVLKSEDYEDVDDVIERTRYINGPTGARCTTELKKKVRWAWERPDDIHIWGYTADERDFERAVRFHEQNPGLSNWCPLIDSGLTKSDCLALLERAGIALPAMYELGYVNNNCIGCVKGGMGYWNKIREDFPEVFARRAAQERAIGHTILRRNRQPLYLDELEPGTGRYKAEDIACGPTCEPVWDGIKTPVTVSDSEEAA